MYNIPANITSHEAVYNASRMKVAIANTARHLMILYAWRFQHICTMHNCTSSSASVIVTVCL